MFYEIYNDMILEVTVTCLGPIMHRGIVIRDYPYGWNSIAEMKVGILSHIKNR